MTHNILIIDDEADIRDLLADIFTDEDYIVHKASHSEQALSIIKSESIDLIVLDIWLENSDMDGVEILRHLKKSDHKNIPVLMISGHGNIEMAVNAMKVGAFDFIEKPFKIDHILLTVARALDQKILSDENNRLKHVTDAPIIDQAHYSSDAMNALYKSIIDNAEFDGRAVVVGAGGVGKTRFTKWMHSISKRAQNALHILNAGALSQSDIDLIVNDVHSTCVIENIESLSPKMQNAVLDIMTRTDAPMARLIVTASPALEILVNNGGFSGALYDRLSATRHIVPSLEQRIDDIPVLVQDFLAQLSTEFTMILPTISIDALKILLGHTWPQNVRQLKLAIEWCVVQKMKTHHLTSAPIHILPNDLNFLTMDADGTSPQQTIDDRLLSLPLKQARDYFERYYLESLLVHHHGNISKMAVDIDMERTALYRKLKMMDITYDQSNTQQVATS